MKLELKQCVGIIMPVGILLLFVCEQEWAIITGFNFYYVYLTKCRVNEIIA